MYLLDADDEEHEKRVIKRMVWHKDRRFEQLLITADDSCSEHISDRKDTFEKTHHLCYIRVFRDGLVDPRWRTTTEFSRR